MRLNYRILWIENDSSWQESAEKMIKDEIIESGFILEIFSHKDYKDLDILSQTYPNFKTFDLILIDFKLDNDLTGDTFIKEVRKNNIFTDILFYSKDSEKLQEVFMNNSLEGVYISNREDFEEKFFQVYRKTIKKFEEINAVRGMVMAETSRLDRIIEDILIEYFKSDDDKRETLKKYILNKIKNSLKSNFSGDTLKIATKTNVEIVKNRVFDAYKKSQTLHKLITLKEFEGGFTHENYNKDVIQTRNELAHAESEIKEGKEILLVEKGEGVEEKEFKQEDIIEIRKNILKYDEMLNEIKEKL